MGGRGASGGLRGGGGVGNAPPSATGGGGPVAVGGLSGLIDNLKNPHQNGADGINTDPVGDYDAGGNADLIRYQQQTDDDKLANYLAGTYKNTNLDDYDDGQYGFHDNSYQKLVLESAAELLLISDSTVKRRYADAIRKLDMCWSGIPWLTKL